MPENILDKYRRKKTTDTASEGILDKYRRPQKTTQDETNILNKYRQKKPQTDFSHDEATVARVKEQMGPKSFIKKEDRYIPEEGMIQHLGGVLDFIDNIKRSFVIGVSGKIDQPQGDFSRGIQYAKEAWDKRRYTSLSDFADTVMMKKSLGKDDNQFDFGDVFDFVRQAIPTPQNITREVGAMPRRFGVDQDGEITFGDPFDVARDMVVDAATSPLTYLSGGLSAVAKGGFLASKLPGLHKILTAGKYEKIMEKAVKEGPKLVAASPATAKKYAMLKTGVKAATSDEAIKTLDKAKDLSKLAEGMGDVAKAAQTFRLGSGAAIGGVGGVAAAPPESSLAEKALWGLGGAVLGMGARAGAPKAHALGQKAMTKLTDDYMEATRGVKGFTKLHEGIGEAFENLGKAANWLAQRKFHALAGLTDGQAIHTTGLMRRYRNRFLELREPRIKKLDKWRVDNSLLPKEYKEELSILNSLKKKGDIDDVEFARKKAVMDNAKKEIDDKYFQQRNLIDNEITEQMDRYVAADLAGEAGKVIHAVRKWEGFNQVAGKRMSDAMKKNPKDRGFLGIKWHVENFADKKEYKRFEDILDSDKVIRAKGKKYHGAAYDLAPKPSFTRQAWEKATGTELEGALKRVRQGEDLAQMAYAEKAAAMLLKPADREMIRAHKLISEMDVTSGLFKKTPVMKWVFSQPSIKTGEFVLKKWDNLLQFFKTNALYASTSWLKNNYWDNLTKAYVQNGLGSVVGTASLRMGPAVRKAGLVAAKKAGVEKIAGRRVNDMLTKYQKTLERDMWQMYRGKLPDRELQPLMEEALTYGIIDKPLFTTMLDDTAKGFIFNDKMKLGKDKFFLKQMLDGYTDTLGRTVGAVGSYFEGTARLNTYVRTRDMLMKTAVGTSPETARKIAAQVTKDTFFDYAKMLHPFEKAVMRRIVPFWGFHSRNMRYWADAILDPERVSRVRNAVKLMEQIGDPLTEEQKQMTSDYLLRNGARFVKKVKGGTRYSMLPTMSMYDAALGVPLSMEAAGEYLEKVAPHIKLPFEIFMDKDLFTKTPLRPSAAGRKFLFSRGFKHFALRKMIGRMGLDPDGTLARILAVNGVEITKSGHPVAKDDMQVILDKVYSTVFPIPIVDQVAGAIGKTIYDRETALEVMLNMVTPMKQTEMSDKFGRQVRKEKLYPNIRELKQKRKRQKELRNEERRERRGERYRERRKRQGY